MSIGAAGSGGGGGGTPVGGGNLDQNGALSGGGGFSGRQRRMSQDMKNELRMERQGSMGRMNGEGDGGERHLSRLSQSSQDSIEGGPSRHERMSSLDMKFRRISGQWDR